MIHTAKYKGLVPADARGYVTLELKDPVTQKVKEKIEG